MGFSRYFLLRSALLSPPLLCPPLFCSLRACDFGARGSHCSTGMQCLVCFAVHASMRKRTLLRQKLNRQNGFPLFLIFFNVNVDPSRNYFNTSYRGDGGCKYNLLLAVGNYYFLSTVCICQICVRPVSMHGFIAHLPRAKTEPDECYGNETPLHPMKLFPLSL